MAMSCTVNEIEWRKLGFEGSRLEYLLAGIGMSQEAHRPADDCRVIGDYDRNTLRVRLDPRGEGEGFEPGATVWIKH
jgi:hypothetical protein